MTSRLPVRLAAVSPCAIVPAAVSLARPTCPNLPVLPPTTPTANNRPFSVLNRPPPNYPGHVPLQTWEKAALALGSGLVSFLNPRRGDMVAVFGETTATNTILRRLRAALLRDPTGRRILRERPRIMSSTLDLPSLRRLPPHTLGRAYVDWLDREHVTPDTRLPVRYIDDEECAYVMQRYREAHDFYHVITGLPTVREGEIVVKAFEFANTGLPMTGLSTLSLLTVPAHQRRRLLRTYLPWAVRNGVRARPLITVYWEEELETNLHDLRARCGLEEPLPDLRDLRNREREAKRAAAAAAKAAREASTTTSS